MWTLTKVKESNLDELRKNQFICGYSAVIMLQKKDEEVAQLSNALVEMNMKLGNLETNDMTRSQTPRNTLKLSYFYANILKGSVSLLNKELKSEGKTMCGEKARPHYIGTAETGEGEYDKELVKSITEVLGINLTGV